jgi:hypothetical protein
MQSEDQTEEIMSTDMSNKPRQEDVIAYWLRNECIHRAINGEPETSPSNEFSAEDSLGYSPRSIERMDNVIKNRLIS